MGDPAGVGPEVTVKALATNPDLYATSRPLVIGDRRILERAAAWLGAPFDAELVSDPTNARYAPGAVAMLDLANDIRSLSDFKRNTLELLDRLRQGQTSGQANERRPRWADHRPQHQ